MSKRKEVSYFADKHSSWARGLDWYKTNFNSSYRINGEASPLYSRFPKVVGVPERIKQTLGNEVKFIYMVRDPVARIVSDYGQISEWRQETGRIVPSFSQILPDIKNDPEFYIQGSSYFLQITQYLEHFPRERLLVILQERLSRDRVGTLRRIFQFLDVDDTFWSPQFNKRLKLSATKRFQAEWFTRLAPAALRKELGEPSWMPWPINRGLDRLARVGGAPIKKPTLTESDDIRLQMILRQDVAALRDFLGDPLPEWRPYL